MPTYDFRCPKCGLQFEVFRPLSRATEPAHCPQDGAAPEASGGGDSHGHTHGPGGHTHGPF